MAKGLRLHNVAVQQRIELLRVSHQVQIARVDNGRVLVQAAFVAHNPSHHFIDLILARRVVAATTQMAVDEKHRASKAVGDIDHEGVLLRNARPRLEVVPAACGDQIAILGRLPPHVALKGQPVVEQRFDLRSRCVSAFAEEIDICVQGRNNALEPRLANGMNEAVAEDIVGTDTQEGGISFGHGDGGEQRSVGLVEIVDE